MWMVGQAAAGAERLREEDAASLGACRAELTAARAEVEGLRAASARLEAALAAARPRAARCDAAEEALRRREVVATLR